MQSVPITTNVMSSNHAHENSIQHYEIKFVSAGWWFTPGTTVSSTNKIDSRDIAELLLKVALNTMTITANTI